MGDILLAGGFILAGVTGYFWMGKIDHFLEENESNDEDKKEEKEGWLIERTSGIIGGTNHEEVTGMETEKPKSALDILKCIGVLACASAVGYLFQSLGFTETNIITIYIFTCSIIFIIIFIITNCSNII